MQKPVSTDVLLLAPEERWCYTRHGRRKETSGDMLLA
jgi:hypothetical protein